MSTDTAASERSSRAERSTVLVDVLVAVGMVVVVVGGIFTLWRGGAGRWADEPFLSVVSWAGAFISLAGVLLAYLIFRRQSWQSKKAADYNGRVLADLGVLLARLNGKVDDVIASVSSRVSDEDAEAGEEVVDRWAAVMPVDEREEGVYIVSQSGKRRRIFPPGNVPLAVIGALVGVWRRTERTGRWDLSSLRGAFRAEGKGNHPWYLVFVPPGESEPVLWKVTRGPNDTDAAAEIRAGGEF